MNLDGNFIKQDILNKNIPRCIKCKDGVIKPDIVFFGEKLSNEFDNQIEVDKDMADLLIVIGSSLSVKPVSNIINFIPSRIPQLLINKTPNLRFNFDLQLLGDCDQIVNYLMGKLNWEIDYNFDQNCIASPMTSLCHSNADNLNSHKQVNVDNLPSHWHIFDGANLKILNSSDDSFYY